MAHFDLREDEKQKVAKTRSIGIAFFFLYMNLKVERERCALTAAATTKLGTM